MMREDKGLEFLSKCSNKDLSVLVDLITKDKDDGDRLTEHLTIKDGYKAHYPNHSKYWEEIASEIQDFGGNSIINIFRGGGVEYKEVLTDVCDKLKVNYNKKSSIEKIEQNLLMKTIEDSMEKLSDEDRKALIQELDIKTTNFSSQAVTMAIQIAIRRSGILYYKIALIVANSVAKALLGRGIAFAGNIAIVRSIAVFSGPVGWVLTGLWTAADIAGPAYRVTIPLVIEVAFLRAKIQYA
jgi:uncharacterized protein YaaW (UPF0174 family)